MKDKNIFSQLVLLVVLCIICVLLTLTIAFLFGSIDTTIFNFSNLNFANMIPIFIIGGIISAIVILITVMFVSRSIFFKVKKYFSSNEKE